jgi:hypothetical protein
MIETTGVHDSMDKRLAREFRERYEAVVAIEAEEERSASMELRWQQLSSILRLARELGLTHTGSADQDIVYQRWARLKGSQD